MNHQLFFHAAAAATTAPPPTAELSHHTNIKPTPEPVKRTQQSQSLGNCWVPVPVSPALVPPCLALSSVPHLQGVKEHRSARPGSASTDRARNKKTITHHFPLRRFCPLLPPSSHYYLAPSPSFLSTSTPTVISITLLHTRLCCQRVCDPSPLYSSFRCSRVTPAAGLDNPTFSSDPRRRTSTKFQNRPGALPYTCGQLQH